MTWQLKQTTVRAINVLQAAQRPLTCGEVAQHLGVSALTARRHLAVARSNRQAALLGNGKSGTTWATPEVAAAKRAEAAEAKRARDEAKRSARRAMNRQMRPVPAPEDDGKPLRVRRTSWPTPTAAPAPTSVFHLGLGLERRVCTYCLREGHLADACPRREREQ